MAQTEKFSVTLSPELNEYLRAVIDEGEYATTNDPAHDALQLWRELRGCFGYSRAELQELLEAGDDASPAKIWDKEVFLKKARSTLYPDA